MMGLVGVTEGCREECNIFWILGQVHELLLLRINWQDRRSIDALPSTPPQASRKIDWLRTTICVAEEGLFLPQFHSLSSNNRVSQHLVSDSVVSTGNLHREAELWDLPWPLLLPAPLLTVRPFRFDALGYAYVCNFYHTLGLPLLILSAEVLFDTL